MSFCLAVFITVVGLASGDPVDQSSGESSEVYRSSVLGFSMEYPTSWSKRPPWGVCGGGGGMPESISDVLARPVEPVMFVRSSGGASVRVQFIRKLGKPLSEEVRRYSSTWLHTEEKSALPEVVITDFTSADGLVGKRLTRSAARVHAAYLLLVDGRLIVLSTSCSPGDWAGLQNVTDRMGGSLKVFPRKDDAPQPGTYKTCAGPGFTLEYPGEWWLARAYDDKELFRFGHLQIFGAYLGFNTSVVVTLHEEQTDRSPRSFVEHLLEKLSASGLKVNSRVTSFITDAGREGSKVRWECEGSHSAQYVLPSDNGCLWVLSCSLDREGPNRTEFEADRIARSLRFD